MVWFDKILVRYADADAPDPILAAGDNMYTVRLACLVLPLDAEKPPPHPDQTTVAACIHEDKGYVLDLIPTHGMDHACDPAGCFCTWHLPQPSVSVTPWDFAPRKDRLHGAQTFIPLQSEQPERHPL